MGIASLYPSSRAYFSPPAVRASFKQSAMTKGRSVAILRRLIGFLLRTDPALWYAVDHRSRSAVSWIPVALLLGLFVFAAGACLVAGNFAEAAFLCAIAVMFLAAKLLAIASRQEPCDPGRAAGDGN
jgi:uncharacterized membrane protein YoaK (UPF0700 family)